MKFKDIYPTNLLLLKKASPLKGELVIPGDKSISHRAVMLGSLADGTTEIRNFLSSADCLSTMECFRKMGVRMKLEENEGDCRILIKGRGLHGLKKPDGLLDVGNSGTTTRLMSGILAAQAFESTITGDSSIQKRPMKRIITPLVKMGAHISSIRNNGCAPLFIEGGPLRGIHYATPVASAQIKSAVLLAGLYAEGETLVTEPVVSRNHTELMLRYFGIPVTTRDTTAAVKQASSLTARQITVPGDISSAAYFIAAALMIPHSNVTIKNVGLNPTRDGILKVCGLMGASLLVENETRTGPEIMGDITVRHSPLNGVTIGKALIPSLIDELPIITVMACFAKGQTIIKDAAELKIKESNRIDAMVHNLTAMGADITATDDGMIINGTGCLRGAVIEPVDDHRIAMAFAIAAMAADGETTLQHPSCVSISYPSFFEDLNRLQS